MSDDTPAAHQPASGATDQPTSGATDQPMPQQDARAQNAPAHQHSGPHASAASTVAQGRGTGVAVASGYSFKERNPILTWLLWPILTLGIYHLVWYYKIHKEMAEFDRRRQVPVAGPMLVLIFLSWTVIAPLISYNNTGQRIRNAQKAAGLAGTCSPVLCWLLTFVFGLNVMYMQSELNKIIAHYGHVPENTVVPLSV